MDGLYWIGRHGMERKARKQLTDKAYMPYKQGIHKLTIEMVFTCVDLLLQYFKSVEEWPNDIIPLESCRRQTIATKMT